MNVRIEPTSPNTELVFDDPNVVSFPERIAGGERRWQSIGSTGGIVILTVAHTIRDATGNEVVRIVSARKASRTERREMAITKKQQRKLEALAAMPDDQIDFSDIPEITDFSGGVRGMFSRPETKHISIRLNVSDLVIANNLAAAKGLPYQTYIKSLLHEALAKEVPKQRTVKTWHTTRKRSDRSGEKNRSKKSENA